ncbi:MAG: hypothetical protein ACR2N3_08990 [Pyrinomonadaceae bacterium]
MILKKLVKISVLSACFSVLGTAIFAQDSKPPINSVQCKNIEISANPTLNPFPLTFSSPSEMCADYPIIDARIVDGGSYSKSQQEWERGLAAKTGDEIYVLMWVENGAASNLPSEKTTAKKVKLTTTIDTNVGSEHFVTATFEGENTNKISARRLIYTPSTDRLEIAPSSGEVYNYKGSDLLQKAKNIGNNIFEVGDIPVDFDKGMFIRFKLRVVKGK